MAGLNKEVWISDLKDNFFQADTFLQDGVNLDPFVDNDVINLAEIGAEPNVERNRTSYPIPAAPRTDNPLALALDEYSSDSTIIRDAELAELVYDKRASVVMQHRRAILRKMAEYGFHAVAPLEETADTPIIQTTGAANAFGKKKLTKEDIAALAKAFDQLQYPNEGRVLVLDSDVFWDFVTSDTALNNQYILNGSAGSLGGEFVYYYGFTIRKREGLPYYSGSAGSYEKVPFGASTSGAVKGMISYLKNESFGRGQGTVEMYEKIKDPDNQGDVINFRMRGIVLPFRQKLLGAIVQVPD